MDLYFAATRHLDPATGRWISQDPQRWQAGDDNLYRYLHNNPDNAVDPSELANVNLRFDFLGVPTFRPIKLDVNKIESVYKVTGKNVPEVSAWQTLLILQMFGKQLPTKSVTHCGIRYRKRLFWLRLCVTKSLRETSSWQYLSPPLAILPAVPPVRERGASTR